VVQLRKITFHETVVEEGNEQFLDRVGVSYLLPGRFFMQPDRKKAGAQRTRVVAVEGGRLQLLA